jgi:hypothetical protein
LEKSGALRDWPLLDRVLLYGQELESPEVLHDWKEKIRAHQERCGRKGE